MLNTFPMPEIHLLNYTSTSDFLKDLFFHFHCHYQIPLVSYKTFPEQRNPELWHTCYATYSPKGLQILLLRNGNNLNPFLSNSPQRIQNQSSCVARKISHISTQSHQQRTIQINRKNVKCHFLPYYNKLQLKRRAPKGTHSGCWDFAFHTNLLMYTPEIYLRTKSKNKILKPRSQGSIWKANGANIRSVCFHTSAWDGSSWKQQERN